MLTRGFQKPSEGMVRIGLANHTWVAARGREGLPDFYQKIVSPLIVYLQFFLLISYSTLVLRHVITRFLQLEQSVCSVLRRGFVCWGLATRWSGWERQALLQRPAHMGGGPWRAHAERARPFRTGQSYIPTSAAVLVLIPDELNSTELIEVIRRHPGLAYGLLCWWSGYPAALRWLPRTVLFGGFGEVPSWRRILSERVRPSIHYVTEFIDTLLHCND